VLRVGPFRAAGGFSPRLWLGGEEELLATDLITAGHYLCYLREAVVHHAPSRQRDPGRRRWLGIRNTLWFTWLRRPLPAAVRPTAELARTVPRDRTSVAAFAAAAAGLPWVLRARRPAPASVEARIRMLDEPRRASPARRYVGLRGTRPGRSGNDREPVPRGARIRTAAVPRCGSGTRGEGFRAPRTRRPLSP
jgi:hypothetical protein